MLTLNSPMATALLRGCYQAIGSFALVFLSTWATTDELKAPVIAGGIAALSALGFRAGVEGVADQRRQARGDVRPSDVGQ